MSADQAPQRQQAPSFIPMVCIERTDGSVAIRRFDLIRGCDTREGLGPSDGCTVQLTGEPPIISKTSPIAIAAQVRACQHWAAVREINEGVALQQLHQEQQRNGVLLPR